jgi:outer membrane protein assembly factor BamD (BamD/ComL family)
MTIRLSQASIAVLLVLCCGCTGLGRKVNQSLPEFMRGDPGKEEKERISHLQQRLAAPPGASAPRTAAFQRAKQAYECGNFDSAASMFEDFIDDYPSSEYDEEARFLWGESHYRANDYTASFSAFKGYAEAYPVSNRAPCIQERVYVMACAYLSGRRRTFLGLFTQKSVGEEMDIWLVQTYPNAPRAADAQWALGRYYVCEEEWCKATAAFDFLVKQYPNSEWFQAARYFAAYTRYRQVKGCRYDPAIVREAHARFVSYVKDFPEGQWRPNAERLICILDNIAAMQILNVAQWYVDQGHCWSARFYLERLEALYPASNAASCGRRLYATLPVNPPCPAEVAAAAARYAAEHAPEVESRPESSPAESRP